MAHGKWFLVRYYSDSKACESVVCNHNDCIKLFKGFYDSVITCRVDCIDTVGIHLGLDDTTWAGEIVVRDGNLIWSCDGDTLRLKDMNFNIKTK